MSGLSPGPDLGLRTVCFTENTKLVLSQKCKIKRDRSWMKMYLIILSALAACRYWQSRVFLALSSITGTVSVPPREKPCRTKVTCSLSSAGRMELEGATFVSLPALEPAQLPWVKFYTEPSWKLLPALLARALLASLGTGWISWTWTLSMCYCSK